MVDEGDQLNIRDELLNHPSIGEIVKILKIPAAKLF
jgi:hypothetical protein